MSRITNEEREHIVREAIAQRDALLTTGQPRKLWLWKNFVDGKPEYLAFDNPFPIHLTDADPQTLGEPCGYAIFKPSRVGRTDLSEAEVLRRIGFAASAAKEAEVKRLREALLIAEQFMSIASDWNIDEAEINGEMRSTYDWLEVIREAIKE
jgi:hypothetical protein